TTIPTRKAETFSTAEDNQPSVEIHVLQGESEMATFNKTLGKFQLVWVPPAPRVMPQIEVSFDIDANGIIHVNAKDLGTGIEQQIRIEGGSGLSEDEVSRMVTEAEAHADEAHRLHELADAKNRAEQLAYQTEKALAEHRDKLDASYAGTIEGRIMEVRQALEANDLADLNAKATALEQEAQPLAQAVYAEAQQSASTPPPSGDGGGTTDEVVEDAEYEVIDDEEVKASGGSSTTAAASFARRRWTNSSPVVRVIPSATRSHRPTGSTPRTSSRACRTRSATTRRRWTTCGGGRGGSTKPPKGGPPGRS